MIGIVAVVVDGRDVHGATPRHFREGVVVEIDGVLHRFGAGQHRVASRDRAVGVNRDPLAERVGLVDHRLELLECEGRGPAQIVGAAGRTKHLHEVGAPLDLLPGHPGDGFGAVTGRPAELLVRLHHQPAARHEHPGTGEMTLGDQVAEIATGSIGGIEIANRGHARLQGPGQVLLGQHQQRRSRPLVELGPRRGPRLPVPVVRHVDVEVDQARHRGEMAEIPDGFALGGPALSALDRHDAVTIHDDAAGAEDLPGAGDHRTKAKHLALGGERHDRNREQQAQKAERTRHGDPWRDDVLRLRYNLIQS